MQSDSAHNLVIWKSCAYIGQGVCFKLLVTLRNLAGGATENRAGSVTHPRNRTAASHWVSHELSLVNLVRPNNSTILHGSLVQAEIALPQMQSIINVASRNTLLMIGMENYDTSLHMFLYHPERYYGMDCRLYGNWSQRVQRHWLFLDR